MNKFLASYIWEILDLGKAQHMDNSVARDMFVANLNNFGVDGAEFYDGAEVDWAALSGQWRAMSEEEQGQARVDCARMMKDKKTMEALREARSRGDKLAFYQEILNYEAEETARPAFLLYQHAWDIWHKAAAEGTDLLTAQRAYVETLAAWAQLPAEQRQAEEAWFAAKVAAYDKGLQYAAMAGDRPLFEGILARR